MVVALRAAVQVALQLARMDHLLALGAFDPPAVPVFLGRLNLDFRLIPRK